MRETPPAGFWIRAIAFAVDVIVVTIVQASFNVAASLVFGLDPEQTFAIASTVSFFTAVFAAIYTTVLHATGGQTIGKRVAGVRVVALDGEPPLGGVAFLRWLAYFASFATFGFGFLMAGLRSDKRALHDLLAGTRVERVARERGTDAPDRRADAPVGRADAPVGRADAPVGRADAPVGGSDAEDLQPVVADEPASAADTRETPPPPTP